MQRQRHQQPQPTAAPRPVSPLPAMPAFLNVSLFCPSSPSSQSDSSSISSSPPSSLTSPTAADVNTATATAAVSFRPTTRDGPAPNHSHRSSPPKLRASASTSALSHASASSSSTSSSSAAASTSTSVRHPARSRTAFPVRQSSLPGAAASPFRRRASSASSSTPSSTAVLSPPATAFFTDASAPPALPDYALSAAAKIHSLGRLQQQSPPSRLPASQNVAGQRIMPGRILTTTTTTVTSSSSPVAPALTPSAIGSLYMSPTLPMTGSNGAAAGGAGAATANGSSVASPPAVSSATASAFSIWQPSEASLIHQQIMDLANKRISTLDYLRKAHEGRVYWFNTYLFDRPDLVRMPYFDPRKLARRATNLLLLGLSVPTINDLYSSSAIEFLRCLNALLSEFDSFQQLHGDSSATLARARLPNMFRRPGGKSRRSTSAADFADDSQSFPAVPGGAGAGGPPSVMTFAAAESDLLPGEEYTYLLTPSLPFEPDFFETFATLCDVLIDSYTRFLALVPTPRECSAPVAELFSKADSRLRKIIVQGAVKEFDDHSRTQVKAEVASIGKVVLSGLM
ncbi:hypothetical protein HIM_05345 [Hirsutella minnesotensis 3608]|uniref:Uncharacterized protein n=1 Tax=Hirsutella minnesotensis 3608 TaxID=1043627 RepID=A0A0F7ZKD6_9HYPO|nr:hypothetical protein HIM_05345 [Hirsutella minnesotensis 3608]